MENQDNEEKRSSLNPQRRRTRAVGLAAFREESKEDRDGEDEMDGINEYSMIAVKRPSELESKLNSRKSKSFISVKNELCFLRFEKIPSRTDGGSSPDEDAPSKSR